MSEVRPRKVMLLIQRMTDGGAQVLVHALAVGLKATGFQPLVCCWGEGSALLDDLRGRGVDVHCWNLPRRSVLRPIGFRNDVRRLVSRLEALVRTEKIELIHSHLHESNMIAALVARRTGCPAILTVHTVAMTPNGRPSGSARNRLRRFAIRRAARKAGTIVAVGNEVARACRDLMGPDQKIVVILNGVRISPRSDERRNHVRRDLGLASEAPVLVCVARLVSLKRHRDLILALPTLTRRHPDLRLWIVGRGPEEQRLRALATDRGVAERIDWLGQREDVPAILAASDIFVLPSTHEGISLALLEAMEASLPVVATDVPGIAEVVEPEVSGILVPVRSPERLAEAIDRLIANPGLSRKLGRGGRRRVETRFDVDDMIASTAALYRETLRPRPS